MLDIFYWLWTWTLSYTYLKLKGVNPSFPIEAHPLSTSLFIGQGVHTRRNTKIQGEVMLADDTIIGEGSHLRGNPIIIGKGTNLVRNNTVVGDVTIGRYCAIAPGVTFQAHNHHISKPGMQHRLYNKTIGIPLGTPDDGPIKIGNDVWIGRDAIILPDVTIGDGAVVGAGSIVTQDVDPYAVVAGVPASLIKWRFQKEIRDYLLNLKWWNWSESKLREHEEFFNTHLSEITDIDHLPASKD